MEGSTATTARRTRTRSKLVGSKSAADRVGKFPSGYSEPVSALSPSCRTPAYTSSSLPLFERQDFSTSPQLDYLCSQAPRGEVFWDYDSPQIRKNRSRLGLDASPAHTPLKVSTPKLLKKTAEKKRPRATAVVATESLPEGAAEAFQELLQFSRKVMNKENHCVPTVEQKPMPPQPQIIPTEADNNVSDVNLSDDESFVIQCTQALDNLEHDAKASTAASADAVVDVEPSFSRSDSFDDILSQLDSEQLMPEISTPELKNNAFKSREKRPQQTEKLLHAPLLQSPVVSSKGIKRFKSSDEGVITKAPSVAGSIRRIHSSPTIPAEGVMSKCSAAEIDRKRQEAKRKRELSQLTNKRV